jgi:hypothetical protein
MVYAGLDNPDNGAVSAPGKRRRRSVRDIGVVLFEGFSLLTAGVIPEVFQVANEICVARSRGDALYDVRFYSAEGGNVACSSSVNVWTYACDARNAIGFDALFIVGGEGAQNAARYGRVVGWLRAVLPLSEVVKPIGGYCWRPQALVVRYSRTTRAACRRSWRGPRKTNCMASLIVMSRPRRL